MLFIQSLSNSIDITVSNSYVDNIGCRGCKNITFNIFLKRFIISLHSCGKLFHWRIATEVVLKKTTFDLQIILLKLFVDLNE